MKTCIVNYITRDAWHPHGQARLAESLKRVACKSDVLLFDDGNFSCVHHNDVPYAFKFYVLAEVKKRGYEQALWVDSSFWAIKEVDFLFDKIREHKFLVQKADCFLGQWTSDICLQRMGIDREIALPMLMFSGGFMGFDFTDEATSIFFTDFLSYAKEGTCFKGSWTNRKKEVSPDIRVHGHRHDMSVGTILMHKANMSMCANNSFFSYYAWYQEYKTEMDLSHVPFLIEGGMREI